METLKKEQAPDLIWAPFFSFLNKEIQRFLKVIFQTVFTPVVNSTLYLLIFGVAIGQHVQLSSGISYLAFLIPGLVMMACLNNAFQNASGSVTSSKFSGDLEDWRVSPLTVHQILWAISLGGLVRGTILAAITLLIGEIFYFIYEGTMLGIAHPGLLFVFITIGGLTFANLGTAVSFWSKSFDQVSAVGAFVLMPLLYLGGVFFSLENLHPIWRALAQFNPLLYIINGVRYGILGKSDVPWEQALVISVVSFLLLHFVALWSLKRGSYNRW